MSILSPARLLWCVPVITLLWIGAAASRRPEADYASNAAPKRAPAGAAAPMLALTTPGTRATTERSEKALAKTIPSDGPGPMSLPMSLPMTPEKLEKARALARARRRAFAQALDKRLREEGTDDRAQAKMRAQMTRAQKAVPMVRDASIKALDCSTSICRIRLSYEDRAARLRIHPTLAAVGQLLGTDSWVFGDGDDSDTLVYLARPGTQLTDQVDARP